MAVDHLPPPLTMHWMPGSPHVACIPTILMCAAQRCEWCGDLADAMLFRVLLITCGLLMWLLVCRDEDAAAAALQGLTGRFYNGRPILVEFSPVTDFREATCRQYEENTCTRGGYCNFMHLRPISK